MIKTNFGTIALLVVVQNAILAFTANGYDFVEKRQCTLQTFRRAPVHTSCIISGGMQGGSLDVKVKLLDGRTYKLFGYLDKDDGWLLDNRPATQTPRGSNILCVSSPNPQVSICLGTKLDGPSESPPSEENIQEGDILDKNDAMAKRILVEMSATGNLKKKPYAEGWVVVSSVARGMGIQKCDFPQSDDMTFMWKPALDGMSADEIYTLNRVITANFRNSERNGQLVLDRLFPATRQAVLMLSDGKGKWNCREISRVWQAARNYQLNSNK